MQTDQDFPVCWCQLRVLLILRGWVRLTVCGAGMGQDCPHSSLYCWFWVVIKKYSITLQGRILTVNKYSSFCIFFSWMSFFCTEWRRSGKCFLDYKPVFAATPSTKGPRSRSPERSHSFDFGEGYGAGRHNKYSDYATRTPDARYSATTAYADVSSINFCPLLIVIYFVFVCIYQVHQDV